MAHGKKTDADKTTGSITRDIKTPRRNSSSNPAAEAAGPRPERSDMARDAARAAATGPRPGARRIAACDLEAKARETRRSDLGVVRGSVLLAGNCAQKTQKHFLLDKSLFGSLNGETLMKAAVICSI